MKYSWLIVVALASCASDNNGKPNATGPSNNAGNNLTMVDATISGSVLLANNYPQQIVPLFRASFTAGSAMARLALHARFCGDPACNDPLAIVPMAVDGTDGNGLYVYSTASTSGTGFDKPFTIAKAPLGVSYLQIVGDTEYGLTSGFAACTTLENCPGDFDVVTSQSATISTNNDGSVKQPEAGSVEVNVTSSGAVVALNAPTILGHLNFDRKPIAAEAPTDSGTLLVALSNAQNTYRNYIAKVDLVAASSHPGVAATGSYVLRKNGADFAGDVCGLIKGSEHLYAIGIDNTGANIFQLSLTTGLQASDSPVATIPASNTSDPNTYPYPCRGVFARSGTATPHDHLYLVSFKGAGSLTSSHPYPFYDVDLSDGTVKTPIVDTQLALRAAAFDGTRLFVADMSWSQSASVSPQKNRIYQVTLDTEGDVTALQAPTITSFTSDEQCDSTLNWPTSLTAARIGGSTKLILGHDTGIVVYDPANMAAAPQTVSLTGYGRLFVDVAASPDASKLYALPQCKAINSASTFRLPYGADDEAADTNLMAVLDPSGATLQIDTTTIDIDENGTPDHGVDLDYYHLKSFIRAHGTTLPIPPVVYTGPQIAVGASMIFLRGSGIQGNGADILSSSGLGQVQDVAFFDRTSGKGVVFGDYIPWLDDLSSMAGTGAAIWGYDFHAGRESSVGAVVYLPAAR